MKDKEKIFIILFEVASVVLAILIAMLFQWVIIPQWKKNQEKEEYFQLYQEIVQTFQAENAKIGECDVVLLGDSLTAGLICTPKVRQTFGGAFFMKKRKRTNKKYSPEFKISVILYMRNNHLSYHETIRKYWGNDV